MAEKKSSDRISDRKSDQKSDQKSNQNSHQNSVLNHDKERNERRIEENSPIPRFNLRDKILIIVGIGALGIYLTIALSQFFGKVLQ